MDLCPIWAKALIFVAVLVKLEFDWVLNGLAIACVLRALVW